MQERKAKRELNVWTPRGPIVSMNGGILGMTEYAAQGGGTGLMSDDIEEGRASRGQVPGHGKGRERAEQGKLEGTVGTRQMAEMAGRRHVVDGLAEGRAKGRGLNMAAGMRRAADRVGQRAE